MANKWGAGKQVESMVKSIANHADMILYGNVLAIDPASRSLGYALFSQTKLVEKGTIQSKKKDINLRLQDISKQLTAKFQDIDLMAVEKIRGSMAHDYLRWSIGMAIAAIGAELVEVPITFWKKLIDDTYDKTDANDAEMIGKVVTLIAEDTNGQGRTESRGKEKEWDTERKLKEQNKQLRAQVRKLQAIVANIDRDHYSFVRDLMDSELFQEERIEAEKQVKQKVEETWACHVCGKGVMRLIIMHRAGNPFYFRKCDCCDNKTKMQPHHDGVKGA